MQTPLLLHCPCSAACVSAVGVQNATTDGKAAPKEVKCFSEIQGMFWGSIRDRSQDSQGHFRVAQLPGTEAAAGDAEARCGAEQTG